MARQIPPSFFERFAVAILLLTLAAAPVLFYAAYRTVRSNTNQVADWLPATFRETDDLQWFRRHFTADEFVIVSWQGCRLGDPPGTPGGARDDPRIEGLAQALLHGVGTPTQGPPAPRYFKSVTTGRRLLNQLTAPPHGVPYVTAVERLQGSVIGPDGRQTCVIAVLTDEARRELRRAIGRPGRGPLGFRRGESALSQAIRSSGLEVSQVHLGGPPVDNAAIDEEGERTLVRLAAMAAVVGLLLAWLSLRSLRLTAIVFACGVLSASAALAAVWWTGENSDAVLMSMPSLVYVLAISGAIHLINYYRSALEQSGPQGAPLRAIARGARPALLCSVTTALGLLSLCGSDLAPIRKFGAYSAAGVMLSLVVLFLFLPAALQRWPVESHSARRRSARPKGEGRPANPLHASLARVDLWQRFASSIIRHHLLVGSACLAVVAAVGWGVTRVETSIDLMKLFGRDAPILRDYHWLEAYVGKLVPMEIVLRVDRSAVRDGRDGMTLLERLQLVSRVSRTIEQRFGASAQGIVAPPLSAVTFMPPLPDSQQGFSSTVRRSVTNSRLEQRYASLLESGYLQVDPVDGAELWRISLRVAAFEGIDYGRFTREVQAQVEPVLARANDRLAGSAQAEITPLSAVYTGVVPVVYKAQRALLDSLIESTLWSFLTITPLLMLVSRGIRAGLVTMLPNALPVLTVFGGMGWLGVPVDIGSMMSASIALGVAVDDTIHYLAWFRRELDESGNRHVAIVSAYRHCATPTLQAALINGLGLSVFAFSTFTPTRQFGFLMLVILLAGVVAELVLLPALLASPLGRVFRPTRCAPALPDRSPARNEATRGPLVGDRPHPVVFRSRARHE